MVMLRKVGRDVIENADFFFFNYWRLFLEYVGMLSFSLNETKFKTDKIKIK